MDATTELIPGIADESVDAEITRERDAGQVLDVEPGDVLVLPDGTAWTVDFLRQGSWVDLHNIRLTQLEEVAA